MRTHEKVKNQLVDFVMGELTEPQARAIQDHAAECSECQAAIDRLRNLFGCAEKLKQITADETLCASAQQNIITQTAPKRPKVNVHKRTPVLDRFRVFKIQLATKYVIAAIILIALGILVISLNNAQPAYALEQTLLANHTIQTIHIRMSHGKENIEKDDYWESWVVYDEMGQVVNFRREHHGDTEEDDDNLAYTVWEEGVLKTWLPLKNVVIILRKNNAEECWQEFAKHCDPKHILQRLYDEVQDNDSIQLTIQNPKRRGEPIEVEARYTETNRIMVLRVDPKTKLVIELAWYRTDGDQEVMVENIEFLDYNQPIDPAIFELNDIQDNAFVCDQVDQLVGIEKGEMTNDEVTTEVVRQCLEAAIAKDYDEVSRLMEGDPGDTVEVFIDEMFDGEITQVIGLGEPWEHEKYKFKNYVPCEIEVTTRQNQKRIVNITVSAKPIGYQIGDRWIMDTDLKADPNDYIVRKIVPGVSVGKYTFSMTKDNILEMLGDPDRIIYGDQKYTLDNLPKSYCLSYKKLSFMFDSGLLQTIAVSWPNYKFSNGIGLGSSEQDIIKAFGEEGVAEESKDFINISYEDKGIRFLIYKKEEVVTELFISRIRPISIIVPGVGVGDFKLNMNKDEVLKRLGKPDVIFCGDEKFMLNNLPKSYGMVYKNVKFWVDGDAVQEIIVFDSNYGPRYKFANGLGFGDSEEDVKQAFGNNFILKQRDTLDFLTYKDEGLNFKIYKENKKVVEIEILHKGLESN